MKLEPQGTPWVIPDVDTLRVTAETVNPTGGITPHTISPVDCLHFGADDNMGASGD